MLLTKYAHEEKRSNKEIAVNALANFGYSS
jgi:hypothetical protein